MRKSQSENGMKKRVKMFSLLVFYWFVAGLGTFVANTDTMQARNVGLVLTLIVSFVLGWLVVPVRLVAKIVE